VSLNIECREVLAGHGTYANIRGAELEKIRISVENINNLVKKKEQKAMTCGGLNDLLDLEIAGLEQMSNLNMTEMIPLEVLESMEKRCDHLVFFETLLNETKRVGIKMQKTLSRIKNLGLKNMECNLETLKENFEQNAEQIALLEHKIKDFIDNEIKLKLRDTKIFEYLHAERATPLLLDLAKKK
jgi:hypothetical protein